MGFLFVMWWGFCVLALGLPGGAVAVLQGVRAGRRAVFWASAVVVAAAALAFRLWLVFRPALAEGGARVWPTQYALVFSVPLLITLAVAGVSCVALRARPSVARDLAAGAGAGLGASIPLQLAAPAFLSTLLGLLDLRAVY